MEFIFLTVFTFPFADSGSNNKLILFQKGNLPTSSIRFELDHYDVIISGEDPTPVFEEERQINSKLKLFQYNFLTIDQFGLFVSKFVEQRHHYGRKVFYLHPANRTQFGDYVQLVKPLYYQPRNELYIDSRLQTYFHLPANESKGSEDLQAFLHKFAVHFPLNSQVYVLLDDVNNGTTSDDPVPLVTELYFLKNQTFVKNVTNNCTPTTIKCPRFPQLATRRRNLKGIHLVFAALNHSESEHCNTFAPTRGNVSMFEHNYSCNQLLWDFQRMLNFSILAKPESNYISKGVGSSLTGMGKVLQTGEVDIVITASYLLDFRLKYLTVLLPVGNEPILSYFLQPHPSAVQNIYNLPFSRRTWIAVLVMSALILVASLIFAIMGVGIHKDGDWWSSQNLFWILCVGCQQDWYLTPCSLSGKILLMTTVFMFMVGYMAYSGAMISGLAYEPVPVSSVQDLVAHEFKFIFDPGVYDPFFHTSPSSNWFAEVLKQPKLRGTFVNDTVAVRMVIEGKVAFLTTTRNFISSYYTLHQNDSYMCETVSKISLSKRFLQSAFFISKGSPLKELFNSRLTILLENGLKHRYWTYYYQRNNSVECSEQEFSYRADLGLDDVISAYLILLTGFLIAILAFGLERKVKAIHRFWVFRNHSYLTEEIIF